MITKLQAMTCNEFHYGDCSRFIGPRGAVREHSEVWRRNGRTQTWVTRPDEFRVPVKYGMYAYSQITDISASEFHAPADCPLRDPAFVTSDARIKVSS